MIEELQINNLTRKNLNREFQTRLQNTFFEIPVNKRLLMKALIDKR